MTRILTAGIAALALAGCVTPTPLADDASPATTTAAMPAVTIYHLEGRRSERIVWLMEALGLPYDLNYVRGDLRGSMAMVHALGHEMPMVPTVVIEDQILVESGAIIDLILSRYATGELTPDIASDDYPVHLMWMHYAEGSQIGRASCRERV